MWSADRSVPPSRGVLGELGNSRSLCERYVEKTHSERTSELVGFASPAPVREPRRVPGAWPCPGARGPAPAPPSRGPPRKRIWALALGSLGLLGGFGSSILLAASPAVGMFRLGPMPPTTDLKTGLPCLGFFISLLLLPPLLLPLL